MTDKTPVAPWYRQPWFWFVMSPLILVVCVSLSFVTVSVFYADDRVVDNYYKQGRTINQSFEQEARARALNLAAEVVFDPVTGEILLNLSGDGALPAVLHLLVGHPVNADQDQRVLLQKVRDGHYRGDLTQAVSHRRYLTLLPDHDASQMRSAEWLLRGEIHFDQRNRIELRPSDRAP